ncbi:unnamed protein product, partial [Urochloa humidicola]
SLSSAPSLPPRSSGALLLPFSLRSPLTRYGSEERRRDKVRRQQARRGGDAAWGGAVVAVLGAELLRPAARGGAATVGGSAKQRRPAGSKSCAGRIHGGWWGRGAGAELRRKMRS